MLLSRSVRCERYGQPPAGPLKPARFCYHRPETLEGVVALLADLGDEAKVLAGGQSLVPLLALRLTRFGHLVDLNRVGELAGMEVGGGWCACWCDDSSGGGRAIGGCG